jgi:hypothetical protein
MKIVLAILLMAGVSWSSNSVQILGELAPHIVQATVDTQDAVNWKKGDKNTYDISIGGFLNGTMIQSVKDITAEGIWMDQNVDLGIQKQSSQILIDPATGAVKKILVDGKEQQLPDQGDQEVVEVKEDKVTVPAGTFDCIFAKVKSKKSGDITQAWINPEQVSVGGTLKVIQPSQFGEVKIALKAFIKN